jgi:glucose-1-phosphate cytidylyltransferase
MKYYAHFGFREFILCLGYRGESFSDYFLRYRTRNSDLTIELGGRARTIVHDSIDEEGWVVTLANTGLNAMTGARVSRAFKYVDGEDFLLTYGDGLCDADLGKLVEHHRRSGKLITVTAVHPVGRFGEMELEKESVASFNEKPQTRGDYINGGFMVVKRRFVREYLADDASVVLERDPMRQAARDGQMAAFRHDGFWQCMDTAREHELLEELWNSGKAPWKVWQEPA